MRTVGIIPARYESTRFPGKPLAMIQGRCLIERVWRQVKKCRELDEIIVATDDRRIADACVAFGARVAMTSRTCASGTDRIAEVARKHEQKAHLFINIQGDEPLIAPSLIDRLVRVLKDDTRAAMATASFPLTDPSLIHDPNVVKVVTDREGFALYFSRSPIPFNRASGDVRYCKHIGIYGYRRDFLLQFARWKETPLEKAERLEQLRALEHGCRIKVIVTTSDSHGVDVPSDVAKIEELLAKSF